MNINEITKGGREFIGYEYKTMTVESERASMYLDGYTNFGWVTDESMPPKQLAGMVTIKLKRDRKILNKMELTRLQQHFESCMDEIRILERSKTHKAMVASLSVGIIGTAFMAGSVFAVTHNPPMILLCILLAIPAFAGWAAPIFLYRHLIQKRVDEVSPLIEQKYDQIYEICKKGNSLMGND